MVSLGFLLPYFLVMLNAQTYSLQINTFIDIYRWQNYIIDFKYQNFYEYS